MKRVFNLIVLDESGSMQTIKSQTISGINETIQSIRSNQRKYAAEQQHFVSLVSFNSDAIKTIYERVGIDEVREYTNADYRPDACTPLRDAVCSAINKLARSVAPDDSVMVTIITDGLENASSEYSPQAMRSLIDEKKNAGWTFVYIGANQDSIAVANDMNINYSFNFDASIEGAERMFQRVGRVQKAHAKMCCMPEPMGAEAKMVMEECIGAIRNDEDDE
ncbi:MAG: VWA domain-containing protein [Bacteroidales bacterium]|nr:VWA domain-containing protein [Bacteroidales bacterium]